MSPRPTASPEARKAQGQMAAAVRVHGPDDPRTRAVRRTWRGESYLAGIAAAVADPPPLDADQRSRLAILLRPAAELVDSRTKRPADASDSALVAS